MMPGVPVFSGNKRARLEGLEPPTHCLEGSRSSRRPAYFGFQNRNPIRRPMNPPLPSIDRSGSLISVGRSRVPPEGLPLS
jgi:hypothetical protein